MADNVAQSIKDLQKDLAALDKQLLSNNANWDKLGQTIVDSMKRGGLGIDDLFSQMKSQKDVLKLRAIIDRDALMKDVKNLQTAVDKGLKSVKVGGVEITGQRQIEHALEGYKAQLKLVPKTLAEAYDYAVKIANTLGGGKHGQQSAISKQRVKDEKDVQKIQEQTTASLQKRIELEERLKTLKPNGKAWREVKEELERVNKQTQEYLAKMGSLGTAGARQLKAYEKAGLITNADKQQVALERQQIDLLRQRMQAEEQLNRLLLQRNNATLAGKTVSPKVTDSISRLQERIDTIDKQRLGNYQNFTQTSLQRIEGMWQNHETALTNIKTQGAQSRQRILDRQTADEQKAIEQQRKLAQRYAEIESLRNQALGGKKYGELNKTELAQWQNFSTLLADVKKQMDTIESKHPGSLLKGQSLQSTDALLQQTKENIRQRDIESKRQAAAEEKRIERELAEDAKRAAKEKSDAEKQRAELEKQNIRDLQAANKAATQEADRLAKAQAKARSAEAKQTFKRTDSESVSNLKRQAEIKQQIARIDHERQLRAKTNSQISTQQAEAERKSYSALQSELSKLISQQKERERLLRGTTAQASTKIGGYADRLQAQEAQRYRQELEKIERQQEKNKRGLEDMLPSLRRLASAFGVAFSVQGLVNFGKKLVETRGQFEMQFVAMKQIIGDVDAATKIWNQTMQQALQSPFKAMQLVDYTKKLAAYRIETDKLFDTTKRLADVSAGLGVDMGRLILAYGQVKTANFLRASEVRQFTEAGVNIYGELAKYFTEIEGRAVSTAEVVERVTKRMVLFSDVEEIFKRMTDEGGTFYNMQEVQAETVRGQIMKLHDAYDQMLNAIGEKHNGALKGMVQTLNSLVKNWKDVEIQLAGAGAALGILLLKTKALPAMAEYFKASNASVVTFNKSLKKSGVTVQGYVNILKYNAIGANAFAKGLNYAKIAAVRLNQVLKMIPAGVWWMALAELVMHFAMKITETTREARRLKKEIDGIFNDNQKSLTQSIQNFDLLRQKIEQTNQNTAERHELVQKINNQYGEYLDNLLTEAMTVEQMAAAYANVATNMRNASKERIKEQATQKIDEKESEEYQDFLEKLYKNQTVWYVAKGAKTREATLEMDRAAAKSIVQKFRDEYLKDVNRKPVDVFYEVVDKYYGIHHSLITGILDDINDYANAIKKSAKEYENLEDRLSFMDTPEYGTKAEQDAIEANRKRYKELEKYENERYEREVKQIGESVKNETKRNKAIEDARKEHERILAEYALATGQASMQQWESRIKKIYGDLIAYEQNYNVRLKKELGDEAQWSEEDIQTYNRIHSDESNTQLGTIQRNKQIKESYERVKEEIEQLNAAKAAGGLVTDQDLNRAKKELADWKLAARLRGIDLTDKKKGRSDNSIYSDRIRLLQDMLQKYRQAAKEAYGYAKAEEKTGQSFEDAWAAIMPEGYGELEVPTSYAALAEMLQRLEEFTPSIDKNGKLSAQLRDLKKAIADALALADLELSVRIREDFGRQMEEAFGNYELTLDLQKLNIPDDVAKDLFPDFDAETLGDLQGRMRMFLKEQGENFDEDDLKKYEEWSKKVESEILKYRKDKAKQYSKYLEKEYSDRAKLQMQYAKDVAFVTANFKDEKQRDNIIKNIDKKFQDDLNELNWKSFKESDFYVEMMEDISSLPAEYTQMMLDKLNEILENPETLSPRALKEAINARQKVLDAQIATQPIKLMSTSVKEIRDAAKDLGGKGMLDTKKRVDEEIVSVQREINEYDELIVCLQNTQGEMKAYEDAVKSTEDAYGGLTLQTRRAIDMLGETHTLGMFQHTIDENQKAIDEINEKEEVGGKLETADRDRRARLQAENDLLSAQIKLINDWIEAKRKEDEIRMRQAGTEAEYKRGQGETSSDVGEQITSAQEETDTRTKRVQELKQWQKAFLNFTKGWESWNGAVNDAINKVASMGNAVYDMYDALGGETNALTEGWKEFGNTLTQTITSTLTLIPQLVAGFVAAGTSINAAMGLVGLIAEAVQLVVTMIGAFTKLHDAHYEKEIENQQKKIDALKDAYARLERQIEKTWSSVTYMQTYEQQVQNIREQIDAMEAQMRAEEAKKNTDDNAVRQYQRDIQDAYDQLEELEQKSIEVFGGIGEEGYRSAAEGFVDAWKSAFLETGDGLQGLQDHFNEFLQDWFTKQATMRIAGAMLEDTFKQIDQAVNKNGDGGVAVTAQELAVIRDRFAAVAPELSAALEQLAGMWDLQGEGSLSGLAAGIQGMTEEQANILEAYWNSVRMYTASIDVNVARIASVITSGGVGENFVGGRPSEIEVGVSMGDMKTSINRLATTLLDNNESTNPMLQQMSLIAANTQATHQLLQSVTRSGHSLGGYGIKVFND